MTHDEAPENLADLQAQRQATEEARSWHRSEEVRLAQLLRGLDERIARADLQAALDADGVAGLLRRWSALLDRSQHLDQAVRGWLRGMHPELGWQNTGRQGQKGSCAFPVYVWAGPEEAGGVADALDFIAAAVRSVQDEDDFPRVEVRVMMPLHDPPRLMSSFAEDPVASLTITPDGWSMSSCGLIAQATRGSCLPLLARAFRLGIDERLRTG
ncbi:hypothetical protein ACFC58_06285 [Kitasatospora purpeofusca]|uniref:hypothetical protein n=1 Tax=Kitasatospora purpeofusca TaxID=67352 RepID=UPI0035E2CCC1